MNQTSQDRIYYASCGRGMEPSLLQELKQLALCIEHEFPALIIFRAEATAFVHFACRTKIASRCGRILAADFEQSKVLTSDERIDRLFELGRSIDWQHELGGRDALFSVKASRNLALHEQITQSRLQSRFAVSDADGLGLPIRATLSERFTWIGLQASDADMSQRLSRHRGQAGLKENLAASIAYQSNIDPQTQLLLDPLCGSGSLLIEALAHCTNAQRSMPRTLCLGSWPDIRPEHWPDDKEIHTQPNQWPQAVGYDGDSGALRAAVQNLEAFQGWPGCERAKIHLERRELYMDWPLPKTNRAWLLLNPPYGDRLNHGQNMMFFYQGLGERMARYAHQHMARLGCWPGYTVVSRESELLDRLGLPYDIQVKLYNGSEPLFLRAGTVEPKQRKERSVLMPTLPAPEQAANAGQAKASDTNAGYDSALAHRLVKNLKRLKTVFQPMEQFEQTLPSEIQERLSLNPTGLSMAPLRLYRLYNADLPEYNCAIDIYEHCCYVQEYQAPSQIDPKKAAARLQRVKATLMAVLTLPPQRILIKTRQRQLGKQQYGVNRDNSIQVGALASWHTARHVFVMHEWAARFIVNLGDYIDTGLFLDHRRLRYLLYRLSANCHVLNLFSYTGSMSVHAGLGGALSTTSVDLSSRYCAWAEHNLALNGLSPSRHQVIRSDVFEYLQQNSHQFELIVIDPPSFSNSKKATDFIVQEHHGALIRASMRHLQAGGLLFFSCNLKRFELDESLVDDFKVQEISRVTQSVDFQTKTGKNAYGGHRCWLIQKDVKER